MQTTKDWQILERRPEPRGGNIVCLANQKGGVGKTTTAVNLAAALALTGHRILLVDLDPQGNATTGLGIDRRALALSTYDLLLGSGPFEAIVRSTSVVGLDLVPATVDLAGAEVELVDADHRELRLARSLRAEAAAYALTLIDCPPSLGLLTVNALACAHDLLVPVQCEYYALEGLGQLVATAERIRRTINPGLRLTGVLLTMYDARTKLAGQVADEVRAHFGPQTFGTVVPRSVRLSEAPSFGEPVLTLDPSSRGSIAHRLLAAEVEERYGLRRPGPPPPVGASGPADDGHSDDVRMARGYGTVAPEPSGLDRSWPPRNAWTSPAPAGRPR